MTGAVDAIALVTRLILKKRKEGARLAVYGKSSWLTRLDHHLWAADPLAFVPHLRVKPDDALPQSLLRTSIWLLDHPRPELNCDSAVNGGLEGLEWLPLHQRIAEIVGMSDEERISGQRRWKAHREFGSTLLHHPLDKITSAE